MGCSGAASSEWSDQLAEVDPVDAAVVDDDGVDITTNKGDALGISGPRSPPPQGKRIEELVSQI
jgi:hypothetical protein